MNKIINANLEWIKSGKMGCTFAAYFARKPKSIGWHFIVDPTYFQVPDDCFLLSILFSNSTKETVKYWAINNGFFTEQIEPGIVGLRYRFKDGISWVQYFGPDADVKTRQTPYPMLTMTIKLPAQYYFKVGFKGILHIAHASIHELSIFVQNRLWQTSISNTKKQLGHTPTIKEAAKTTFHEK